MATTRLPQALSQTDHGAVELPQLLFVFRNALFQHKPVVGQGLDLQKVVEGGNPLQLLLALVADDGLKQLSRLTGRADDEALPIGDQLRLGNSRIPFKVLQIAQGNQVVQIPQSRLVLGEKDDMPGMAVANFIFGPQGPAWPG